MREKMLEVLNEFNEELVEDLERDLFVYEILDSFDIVKLVMMLEEEFDITIGVDLVTAENFQTTESIITMMETLV